MLLRRHLRCRRVTGLSVCAAVLLLGPLAVSAQSPWDARISRFDVPEGCTDRAAFEARLETLGAVPGTVAIAVEVTEVWSGLLRGVVLMTRAGGAPVERAIEDEVCADVLDALAIAAALSLRQAPSEDVVPAPREIVVEPVVTPPVMNPLPPEPASPRLRVAIGAGLRVGLGPVPGLSVAPDLSLTIEIDRLVVAVHALGWPEAAAPSGREVMSPGVALYALGATLELGGRIGDDLAVVPAAVLELGAVIGRGLAVERSRTDAALACDAGVAVTLELDVEAVRFFVRADLLFAVTQPSYVVGGAAAYQTPIARGTGMLGVSYVFGS